MMSDHEDRGRAIIAPVGDQAAAVFAPLLSPPLAPTCHDTVLLIASGNTLGTATRLQEFLSDSGATIEAPLVCNPFDLGEPARRTLAAQADGRETWFLANGGRGEWMSQALDVLAPKASSLHVADSRDNKLRVVDWRSGNRETYSIGPLGRQRLLGFLDLRFDKGRKLLSGGRHRLPDVSLLLEYAGLLFAVLDAAAWTLQEYRRRVLDDTRLKALGLEQRRVILHRPQNRALVDRAIGDGVPVSQGASDLKSWTSAVTDGTAMDWPERGYGRGRLVVPPPTAKKRAPRDGWTGDALVVTSGPQPGSTILATWSHQPTELHLVYDSGQPLSAQAAWRLADDENLGATQVYCHDLAKQGGLRQQLPATGNIACNLTPGDKWAKLLLAHWARNVGPRVAIWSLKPAAMVRLDNQESRDVTPAPLATWVRMHAPGPCEWDVIPDGVDFQNLARDLLACLTNLTTAPEWLAQLNKRRDPPCLRQQTLIVDSGREIALNSLPPAVRASFRPMVEEDGQGRWFEWIVAEALRVAKVNEVFVAVRGDWARQQRGFRDDLDVVTRQGCAYTYWSCKTTSKNLESNLREAAGQAARLLGRRSLAVLVVPHLVRQPTGVEEIACGHWRLDNVGHIVDARLLARPEEVRALAGMERPQGR